MRMKLSKKELYQMEKETNEADSLKEENEQLRQLLDMKSKLNATKLIAADVIIRTPADLETRVNS